jgi:hypothetical protein
MFHPDWRRVGVAAAGLFLLVRADQASAQSDEMCTATAVRSVLSTFSREMKVDFECDRTVLAEWDDSCQDDSTEWAKLEAALDKSITAACPAPNLADSTCASAAAGQYDGLIETAGSQGDFFEGNAAQIACRLSIANASQKLAKKRATLLRKCNSKVLAGDAAYGPAGKDCRGPSASQETFDRADQKLRSSIARRCGGADGAIGGDDDFDPLFDLDMESTCLGGPDCELSVSSLTDLVDCVTCVAGKEVGEAVSGALSLPLDAVESCRVRLERSFIRHARDSMSLRWRCEREVLGEAGAPACPSASVLADIAASEADVAAEVTESCGSLDPQDDIGFLGACPAVGSCGAIAVDEFPGLIECLSCVTAFRTSELLDSAVPVSALETDDLKQSCRMEFASELGHGSGLAGSKLRRLGSCNRNRDCGITTADCPDERTTHEIDGNREYGVKSFYERCSTDGDADLCAIDPVACGLLDPQDLGFAATCPDVLSCGGQETDTFAGLANCLTCIADATAQDLSDLYSPWP